jgi:hypothetical protein
VRKGLRVPKAHWRFGAVAICLVVSGCGGAGISEQAKRRAVATALESNPSATLTAVHGGNVTVVLDPNALAPLPAGGQVAVPVLVSNRSDLRKQARLTVALNPALTLTSAAPALPREGPARGWSCSASSCRYLERMAGGATRPAELAAGAQLPAMLVVAAAAGAPTGHRQRISVSPGAAARGSRAQSALLRIVAPGAAAPALAVTAEGTTAGITPGGVAVARYQVLNRGSAPVAPGALTLNDALPHGLARDWTVADPRWSCTGSGDPTVPACRLRTGVRVGEQAPELTVAYHARSAAKGQQTWTAVARAADGGGPTAAAPAKLPLSADMLTNASPPSAVFAGAQGAGLSVGIELNDSLRRMGHAPLQVTIVNSGNRSLRPPIRVLIPVPSGLKAGRAGGAGWSCDTKAGRTVTCRTTRTASVAVGAAMAPIRTELSVGRNARTKMQLTVLANDGSMHGSNTLKLEVLRPFTVRASGVPSVVTSAPSAASARPAQKDRQGILIATPSDPREPGVVYRWHQLCTRQADVGSVRGCRRVVPRVRWLVPTRGGDAIAQSARYLAPYIKRGGQLRFTVAVSGAGNQARGTTTVLVQRHPAPVIRLPPTRVRVTPKMPGYRQVDLARAAHRRASDAASRPLRSGAAHQPAGDAADLRQHRALLAEYRRRAIAPLPRGQSSTTFCEIFDKVSSGGEARAVALRDGLTADFLAASTEGSSCTDANAKVAFGGQSAVRVGAFTLQSVAGSITSGGVRITGAAVTAPSGWGSLSFRVNDTTQLEIKFGDGSAVEPLAGVLTSSTFAIVPLPEPMGSSGTHTTDLVFGAGPSGIQTVSIAGTAAAGGATAEISGSIRLDGTFELDARVRGIFRVGECSVDVAGKVRRAAPGGPISKELSGTAAACKPFGNVTLASASVKWADGVVRIDGRATIAGPGTLTVPLAVTGQFASLGSWRLAVSTDKGFTWEPAEFLKISKLEGSLSRENGRTTFNLGGQIQSWKVNDNLVFGESGVRITNECPAGQTCEGSVVRVLFDLKGDFYPRYALSFDFHFGFKGTGVVEIPSGAISVSVEPGLGKIPLGTFELKNPKLGIADAGPSADGSSRHTIAVTLSATASFWGKDINARVEFSQKGYYLVGALGDWSPSDGFGLKDANVVYTNYDQEREYGQPGRTYKLKLTAGQPQIGASYPIAPAISSLFGDQLVSGYLAAQVSFDKVSLTGEVHFNTRTPDIYILGNSSSFLALKASDPHLTVSLMPAEKSVSIGIASNVSFVYPKFKGGERGSIDLKMAAALEIAKGSPPSISGSISNTTGWDPFMGIPGFNVKQFAISVGYTVGSPKPGFGIAGTVSVPGWLAVGLNLTPGTDVSLAMKLDAAQPCLAMGVSRSDGGNAIDLLQAHVVTAKHASFVIAPKGCDIGDISYPSGASLNLDARIFGVDTKFYANVALEGTFAMKANVDIGEWDIANIIGMEKTHLDLDIGGATKKFIVAFSGGVHVPGAVAHVDGDVFAKNGLASLKLKGSVEGAKLGPIKIPGRASFDVDAEADLGTVGAIRKLSTTMDAQMDVLGSAMRMHFDLQYANLNVKKASASQEATLNLHIAKLVGKVAIGYADGQGSAGYEGRIEAFGFPLFSTSGKLDASLSELAVDAELVNFRSPWIGIYLVNFRGSVNLHVRGNLSFDKFNVGASGRAEIEGEVCYFVGCSGFGSIGVSPEFNFNPFKIKLCASIPVVGWQCIQFGSDSAPAPPPPLPPIEPLPAYLAPGAMIRMYSHASGLHFVARGGIGVGAVEWSSSPWNSYSYEGTAGFLNPTKRPGEQLLWSCDWTNNRQFVSKDDSCERQRVYGPIGASWINRPTGDGLDYKELFRCFSAPYDHFVSDRRDCEGTKFEGSLGWIAQSQPRLITYINAAGVHTETSRSVGPEAGKVIGTVGFLLPSGGPGRVGLYGCQSTADNKPRFLSTDKGCGGGRLIGVEGWIWDTNDDTGTGRQELHLCQRVLPNRDRDSYVSLGATGCGPRVGYIDRAQSGLDRYFNGTRHWVSTRAVPPQYQFEQRLGYLLPRPAGNDTRALYSCLDDTGAEFVSRDHSCDGSKGQGIDGWVYTSREAAPTLSLEIFSCAVGRDRFVSLNPGCEGQANRGSLGWVTQNPPG